MRIKTSGIAAVLFCVAMHAPITAAVEPVVALSYDSYHIYAQGGANGQYMAYIVTQNPSFGIAVLGDSEVEVERSIKLGQLKQCRAPEDQGVFSALYQGGLNTRRTWLLVHQQAKSFTATQEAQAKMLMGVADWYEEASDLQLYVCGVGSIVSKIK